ncbi:tRNA modification GTPase [Roseimaritima ulvae]|uniref:tRNA modification GTPase MnmE n=1 Tax=Roseimaritima ulvae TaxID=980254 RepID=A0A5B9R5F7_9BACT|nr:tRNA modification GTPase [Roseimaritima ulvae]QEG41443.1 tRNA modification GTPase MnmE [Roseimaritima ulvae]
MSVTDETICAVASAPLGAAQGIVRVSGADAVAILQSVLPQPLELSPQASRRLPIDLPLAQPLGVVQGAALVWPTNRSYTGQPAVELHLPGCLPLLDAAVETLVHAGARPARPGEFTLRAFLAGRLDLTQAEAVLGVIDADDQRSLELALDQLAGGLSAPLSRLRGRLLDLLSHLEAGLDFVEEDIEFISQAELGGALDGALQELSTIRSQMTDRSSTADLPLVVLRGRPNAGKSRLMNALAGSEAAIVADVAGTTRDPVHAQASFGGHQVRLADTAGMETGRNDIEHLAQTAGLDADRRAVVRLVCWDATDGPPPASPADSTPTLRVQTKVDLLPEQPSEAEAEGWIATSSLSGEGIERLKQAIAAKLDQTQHRDTGSVAGTAARCSASLDQAIEAIEQARAVSEAGGGEELVAAEMRIALTALGEVTGEIYTDDILDRIFSRFCIGK